MAEDPATIAEQFRDARTRFAAHPALLTAEGWLTFAELGQVVDRAAGLLAECGAGFGDRVVLVLENCAMLRILEYAVTGSGMVRVAVSPRLHPAEVAAIAVDAGAAVVCCSPEQAGAIGAELAMVGSDACVLPCSDDGQGHTPAGIAARVPSELGWREPGPGDLAMLMYSSGTTGAPKAAMLTHGSWVAHTRASLAALPPLGPGDVVLAVAPMSHFGGSIGLDCATQGAATVPVARFDPAALPALIERHNVTVLPIVPVMLAELIRVADGTTPFLPGLRGIVYGGSSIELRIARAAAARFPGILVQFYGTAEALAPVSVLDAAAHDEAAAALADPTASPATRDRARRVLESAGTPVDDVEFRICDGELQVRGPMVMPGYWNRPELTCQVLRDGWYSTGDLVQLDDDGRLRVVGRTRDVIVSGGFNVAPGEVERATADVAGVGEVVVLGRPHPRWGEGVTAVVTLDDDGRELYGGAAGADRLLEALVIAARSRLAGYKKPVAVEIVDAIPRNAAGKVDRARLRSALEERSKGA